VISPLSCPVYQGACKSSAPSWNGLGR
jgi:hypothetical protein